ncbi:MAG: gliding motility-associated C-terminal domain-containing protein, partial [Bacteroidota bacterium]
FTSIASVYSPDSLSVIGDATPESVDGAGDATIELSVSGGTVPYDFLWEDGTISQNRENLSSGIYIVTVTDDNDCVATTLLDFNTLEGGAGIDGGAEDIFTPNGDNINDEWTIKDIQLYPNNEVFIFNRWGQIVYNVDGYMNTWTGTNNDGEELQTGAYWYIVKFNDPNDIQFSGVVTIVR